MIDSDIYTYEQLTNMVIVDASERRRLQAVGIRRLMRELKLSQTPVSNVIKGKPVRPQTLSVIRQAVARISF